MVTTRVDLPHTRLLEQLNTGTMTEGDDCTVCASLTAMKEMTDDKVGPKVRDDDADWIEWFRRRAGKLHGGLRIRANVYRAWTSTEFKRAFTRRGLKAPEVHYYYDLSWTTLRKRLSQGWTALLAVDYGTLRQGSAPIGSLTFGGGHMVMLRHATNRSPGTYYWTADGDSLFDGRQIPGPVGGSFPKGWREAKLVDFKLAAGKFGTNPPGYGRCTVILVRHG